MMFRLIVFVVALALLPTSLLAGPRPFAAAPFPADISEHPMASVSGKTGASTTAESGKRCMRGAMPAASCAADIGMPVTISEASAKPVKIASDNASPTIAGLSPGCLVGPPRTS